METHEIIISVVAVAVITTCIITLFQKNKNVTITIKLDEDYPIKDDGVEELEVKPKRKYVKKAIAPKDVIVTKRPVGRPRKSVK